MTGFPPFNFKSLHLNLLLVFRWWQWQRRIHMRQRQNVINYQYMICYIYILWGNKQGLHREGSKNKIFPFSRPWLLRPRTPPTNSRPVEFWNVKTKFKCCGGCHRSWNGFYVWNRWKNVYEKQMSTPSKSQISPLRPIKNWEEHWLIQSFFNSKVCFRGPRSHWNTPKKHDL